MTTPSIDTRGSYFADGTKNRILAVTILPSAKDSPTIISRKGLVELSARITGVSPAIQNADAVITPTIIPLKMPTTAIPAKTNHETGARKAAKITMSAIKIPMITAKT